MRRAPSSQMDSSGLDGIFYVMVLAFLAWLAAQGPQELLRAKGAEAGRAVATRVMVAVWIGVGFVGFSMYPSTHDFWPPYTVESMALRDLYSTPGEPGRTGAVAGFPWQGVEGCPDGAWSTGPSRWRTSAALWFNFACFSVVGGVFAFRVGRSALRASWVGSIVFGTLGFFALFRWILDYRD